MVVLRRILIVIRFALLASSLWAGQDSAPVRVGGDIKPPLKVKDVPAIFPAEAKLFGIQGMVILETSIEADGTVGNIRVLRSIPLLDWGAVATVSQWEYEPTLLNGERISVVMTVTVNYSLGRSASSRRREGEAILNILDEGEADDASTWPPARAELELTDYALVVGEDGSRTYSGTIRNISGSSLPNLRAVVVHRERWVDGPERREMLTPTVEVVGTLEDEAEHELFIHTPNDGSVELKKVVLLFTKRDGPMVQLLVPTRGSRGALGSRN